jgi:plastocyanin
MRKLRARLTVPAAALIVSTMLAAACSGSDPEPTVAEDGGVAPGSAAIGIADFAFEPTTLTVAAGSIDITITNADSAEHTFTLDDGSVDEPIAPGQETTVTVDLSASIGFHCEIHPAMTGTIQVA